MRSRKIIVLRVDKNMNSVMCQWPMLVMRPQSKTIAVSEDSDEVGRGGEGEYRAMLNHGERDEDAVEGDFLTFVLLEEDLAPFSSRKGLGCRGRQYGS